MSKGRESVSQGLLPLLLVGPEDVRFGFSAGEVRITARGIILTSGIQPALNILLLSSPP